MLVALINLNILTRVTQNVRRLALSALNSAARTKPYLIRDHLPTLLPSLYAEMKVNPDLIRTVQMGPWTHKVDDGLDARKTAWETLYTLVSIRHTHVLPSLMYSLARYLPRQTRPVDLPLALTCSHQRSIGRDQSDWAHAPRAAVGVSDNIHRTCTAPRRTYTLS